MQRTADNVLVWVDLEMTGLDPETCAIVEMAMILTDTEFNQLTEPLN
ncbi:MAG: exonuclease domain-containing protein, partial [Myxococcota bacterium]|nr:exonuclease domain-containing protein [Myxococcota bacterium]